MVTRWGDETFELGEGARWIGGSLVFVDLLAGRLLSADPGTPGGELRDLLRLPVPLSAVAPIEGGQGLLAACGNGLRHLGGTFTLDLAAPGTRMNDAAADPSGAFWAGSMSGVLFRWVPDQAPQAMWSDLTVPNGPAFHPGGTVMYFADSRRRIIFRAVQGVREVFARVPEGSPDGMNVDVEGNLWVAVWGGGFVRRYRPDATVDLEIAVPARQPSSVCLVGRRLFITSARYGLPSPSEQDGALFAVDVDIPGVPAAAVAGLSRSRAVVT